MVTTTTLQPVASLIFRAASRAFISSGLVMVCMDARFRVPSGFTATLPEVSGTCLMETMIFIKSLPHNSQIMIFSFFAWYVNSSRNFGCAMAMSAFVR